jgi:hypothetical protein
LDQVDDEPTIPQDFYDGDDAPDDGNDQIFDN